jgi:hypothetical protein
MTATGAIPRVATRFSGILGDSRRARDEVASHLTSSALAIDERRTPIEVLSSSMKTYRDK